MKKWIMIVSLAIVGAATQAQAFGPVKYLGTVKLTEFIDRDVLHLPACGSSMNTGVKALKLKVTRFPAEINHLRVVYGNGTSDVLHVRQNFNAGSESRWIDLAGWDRCIRKIFIIGDTNTPGFRPFKQARVSFYGLK